MKRLCLLACLLVAGGALAAVTISNPVWTLEYSLDGVARKDAAASEADCNGKGIMLAEPARSRTWKCVSTRVTKRATAPPPPAPVDCQVTAWTDVAGEWSTCSSGTQTRTVSRARSVITQPANGGQACPTLVGSSVESRSCTVDPPPVDPPTGNVVYASPPIRRYVEARARRDARAARWHVHLDQPQGRDTPAAWTTLRAEHDGAALVPALNIGAGNWYLTVEGVKAAGSGSSVTGGFVKFKRVAFKGGPSSGNGVSLQIGTNDRTPGAHDILVEDSWVYGAGGRYKLLVYNSERVVIRRAVVRHDGGWTPSKGDPQGGITIYDSAHVRVENSMCVDSVQGLAGFESCIYLVSNGTTSTKVSDVVVNGAIVIDSPNNGSRGGGQRVGNLVGDRLRSATQRRRRLQHERQRQADDHARIR
jgi:hypothetical protein